MGLQLGVTSVLEHPDCKLHALLLQTHCGTGPVHTAQNDLQSGDQTSLFAQA